MEKELLESIYNACQDGLSEREIKSKFNLTDWDYQQARKIFEIWGQDYGRNRQKHSV